MIIWPGPTGQRCIEKVWDGLSNIPLPKINTKLVRTNSLLTLNLPKRAFAKSMGPAKSLSILNAWIRWSPSNLNTKPHFIWEFNQYIVYSINHPPHLPRGSKTSPPPYRGCPRNHEICKVVVLVNFWIVGSSGSELFDWKNSFGLTAFFWDGAFS
jgi:hypothetical protein